MKYITCLTLIFCSGYYFSITEAGSRISLVFLLICSCAILLAKRMDVTFTKSRLGYALLFAIAVVVSSIFGSDGLGFVDIKQLAVIACALLVVSSVSWESFRKAYIRVMVWVSIFAVIGYILEFTPLISYFPVVENYNGEFYVSGGLFSIWIHQFSGLSSRMQGLFWEPGLYATYLLLAIVLLRKEDDTKRLHYLRFGFFILCVILSSSGAGVLLLPIAIVVRIVCDQNDGRSASRVVSAFCIVLMVIVFIFGQSIGLLLNNEWLNTILVSKLQDSSNVSNFTRVNAVIVDLDIFKRNLPFGVGLSEYAATLQEYYLVSKSSGTSTLTTLIAEFGLLGVVISLCWLKGIISFAAKKGPVVLLGILLLFLGILSKEPHGNLLLMNCLMMYFLNGNMDSSDSVLRYGGGRDGSA